jgi:hypothetical protein
MKFSMDCSPIMYDDAGSAFLFRQARSSLTSASDITALSSDLNRGRNFTISSPAISNPAPAPSGLLHANLRHQPLASEGPSLIRVKSHVTETSQNQYCLGS